MVTLLSSLLICSWNFSTNRSNECVPDLESVKTGELSWTVGTTVLVERWEGNSLQQIKSNNGTLLILDIVGQLTIDNRLWPKALVFTKVSKSTEIEAVAFDLIRFYQHAIEENFEF